MIIIILLITYAKDILFVIVVSVDAVNFRQLNLPNKFNKIRKFCFTRLLRIVIKPNKISKQ